MDVYCIHCQARIAVEDVNVPTGVALCRACGEPCRYSELLRLTATSGIDMGEVPAGTEFEKVPDGFRLRASTRSLNILFLVPFTCIWSGISLSGIYGGQLTSGQFDAFSSLFGVPFLLGTVALIAMCVMSVAGDIVVTLSGNDLFVFQGVGYVGWTRRFAWSDFNTAREERYGRGQMVIVLDGFRDMKFGSLLSAERRHFVVRVLRRMMTATRFQGR